MKTFRRLLKKIKFSRENEDYILRIYQTQSTSNYNLWAHVLRPGDKTPLVGTSFRDDTKTDMILKWANTAVHYNERQYVY